MMHTFNNNNGRAAGNGPMMMGMINNGAPAPMSMMSAMGGNANNAKVMGPASNMGGGPTIIYNNSNGQQQQQQQQQQQPFGIMGMGAQQMMLMGGGSRLPNAPMPHLQGNLTDLGIVQHGHGNHQPTIQGYPLATATGPTNHHSNGPSLPQYQPVSRNPFSPNSLPPVHATSPPPAAADGSAPTGHHHHHVNTTTTHHHNNNRTAPQQNNSNNNNNNNSGAAAAAPAGKGAAKPGGGSKYSNNANDDPNSMNFQNLFITKIPRDVTDGSLLTIFRPLGAQSAKVMVDAASGYSKGFGFVVFPTESQGRWVHEQFNKKPIVISEENLNSALPADRPTRQVYEFTMFPSHHDSGSAAKESNSLYIRNVPRGWDVAKVVELLRLYGDPVYYAMRDDRLGNPVWVVYVEYDCLTCSRNALKHIHGLRPALGQPPILAKYADNAEVRKFRRDKRNNRSGGGGADEGGHEGELTVEGGGCGSGAGSRTHNAHANAAPSSPDSPEDAVVGDGDKANNSGHDHDQNTSPDASAVADGSKHHHHDAAVVPADGHNPHHANAENGKKSPDPAGGASSHSNSGHESHHTASDGKKEHPIPLSHFYDNHIAFDAQGNPLPHILQEAATVRVEAAVATGALSPNNAAPVVMIPTLGSPNSIPNNNNFTTVIIQHVNSGSGSGGSTAGSNPMPPPPPYVGGAMMPSYAAMEGSMRSNNGNGNGGNFSSSASQHSQHSSMMVQGSVNSHPSQPASTVHSAAFTGLSSRMGMLQVAEHNNGNGYYNTNNNNNGGGGYSSGNTQGSPLFPTHLASAAAAMARGNNSGGGMMMMQQHNNNNNGGMMMMTATSNNGSPLSYAPQPTHHQGATSSYVSGPMRQQMGGMGMGMMGNTGGASYAQQQQQQQQHHPMKTHVPSSFNHHHNGGQQPTANCGSPLPDAFGCNGSTSPNNNANANNNGSCSPSYDAGSATYNHTAVSVAGNMGSHGPSTATNLHHTSAMSSAGSSTGSGSRHIDVAQW